MSELMQSVAKITAYVFATLIIIFAVAVTTLRLITPLLDTHKQDIERWATELLDVPVSIQKTRITWYQYQPEVTLQNVTLLNKDTLQPSLNIKEISIFFSIPKSIWHWRPVSSGIMISGAAFNVSQDEKQDIAIQGFPGEFGRKPYQSETKFKDMLAAFYAQPLIILRNIDIQYTNYANVQRFVTLYDLRLENRNQNVHRLLGRAVLHQQIPTEATLVVRWHGNDLDVSKIRAKMYVYVSGLSLSQWFKNYRWQNWQIDGGLLSAKVWATWRNNQFQKIQTLMQAYDVTLHSLNDQSIHKMNRISGNFGWKREGLQTILAGDDMLIDLPNRLWPMNNFYLTFINNHNNTASLKTIHAAYINIEDVQPYLFASRLISDANQQQLLALKLSGSLTNTDIDLPEVSKAIQTAMINTDFNQISFSEQKQIPAIKNISGHLKWNGQSGVLSLRSNRVELNKTTVFMQPIMIDQLSGDIAISRDTNAAWQLQIKSLQLLNADVAANVHGDIAIPVTQTVTKKDIQQTVSPKVNLQANFTVQQANRLTRYLPLRLYKPDLIEWLQKAFLSGEIPTASATLQGTLADFPFDKKTGVFALNAKIKNLDLHFAPHWPDIKRLTGDLNFTGRQLQLSVDHAQILDIPLTHAEGEIPYLADNQPAIFKLKIPVIETDFPHGIAFVKATPLQKTLGKLFEHLDVTGPLKMNVDLSTPLKRPEETTVSGDMVLNQTELKLVPWNLQISSVNGQLHYTENTVAANHVTGSLFNKPIQMNLSTLTKNKNTNIIQLGVNTNISITDLEQWTKFPVSTWANGSTNISALIDFSLNEPMLIQLHSDLMGMSLLLPNEFAKPANKSRQLDAAFLIADDAPLRAKIYYDDLLSIAAILQSKNNKYEMTAAQFQLNGGNVNWPVGNGYYVSGNFDELNWDKIKTYLGQSHDNKLAMNQLKNIDVHAKVLNLFGQRIHQVHIQLTPKEETWHLSIASPSVVGAISVPTTLNANSNIHARFEKIKLTTPEKDNAMDAAIDVKSLPNISFSASNVIYNDVSFGDVAFKTQASKNGLNILYLKVNAPVLNLQAYGNWSETNVTHLTGNASSKKIRELLLGSGLNAHNFLIDDGKINFDLNWKGAPFSPQLAKLNGDLTLNLSKGRIVDVGNDATMGLGRMLSIFSLQSIPRRLTFNFSDVFQKGYSFDSLTGDFSLKNGDAYTDNMQFNGPAARVAINGRIGFKKKDYDFTLSITPYVSTIPFAAAAWVTGPIGGVAALALSPIVGQAVSKIATYHYTINGSWSNPSWEPLNTAETH